MNNQRLKDSIKDLYKVFAKYPLKDKIEGCPCCVGKSDNRVLHSKPLRQLSGEDLSFYAFKAITTFGNEEDFKHFLPRLFEIAVENELAGDTPILFGKLNYANWQNWDEQEKVGIEKFFIELFRFAVDFEKEDVHLTEDYLISIASAVEEITPYLDLWFEDISENKILTLKYFVVDCNYGMSDAFLVDHFLKRLQIQNWLISDKTTSILEELYFNVSIFKDSGNVSKILEKIYEIKNESVVNLAVQDLACRGRSSGLD